jgi:hypothetical protein
MRHSHTAIRRLLAVEQSPSAVDALAIARLQLETLYSLCFLLQDPENIRLYLKNGWKKKYVRFLLEREECRELPRFDKFLNMKAGPFLDGLQKLSSVSDEEKRTIEIEELGAPFGPQPQHIRIRKFPTPMGVIDAITEPTQKKMLARLYPEYQYLCSFAHGDSEASLFRVISNKRSVASSLMSTAQIEDFYQRAILETPFIYSALSAIQAATEIAAFYPGNLELLVKVTKAWEFLRTAHLLSAVVWKLRAKHVLPLIGG